MPRSIALVLTVLAAGCGTAVVESPVDAPLRRATAGAQLFERHCVLCHGPLGTGDGPAAALLFPPARDFTRGRFRLVGSENGAPSVADLVATLRRGVPGSAMPSWDGLPDRDLEALARTVRRLATDGLADRLLARDPELDVAGAAEIARERMTPGPALDPFVPKARTPERLARGRELYAAHCAPCHGLDGRGSRESPRWNEDGSLNWARDFTAGILKGGAGDRALARRILLGLPGTAMPPLELESEDLAAVVAYVQSLLPPGSADELVQRHARMVAERVDGRVPWVPDDPRWDAVPEAEIVLAPLFWSWDAVFTARVRVVHDGAQLAVRLAWSDDSADGSEGGPTPFPDACALLFSSDDEPPLFGMGASDHPSVLWHWRSAGPERGGSLATTPHGFGAGADSLRYREARPWTDGEARAFGSGGFEHLSPVDGADVRVRAQRTETGWEVVFVRLLRTSRPGDVAIEPGRDVALGCAIWNGSAGEHRGRKSVTIWHTLEVAP